MPDFKMPAGPNHRTGLICMRKNAKLALNLAMIVVYQKHPPFADRRLGMMFHEFVGIYR